MSDDITARAREIAAGAGRHGDIVCIPARLLARILDQWEARSRSLREQARAAPARTATDRGIVVSLHREADVFDACRYALAAAVLAEGTVQP